MPPDDFSLWIAPARARMTDCVWRIVRNSADVDDVLQDVLVHAWERFDQLRHHPNPTALLMRICTQRSLDLLRRRRVRTTLAQRVSGLLRLRPATPRQKLTAADQRDQLRAFIASLPAREAEAISLHALEEFEYAEVAAAMGCTESTVRVLINRARARFRGAFEPQDRPATEREDAPANEFQPD